VIARAAPDPRPTAGALRRSSAGEGGGRKGGGTKVGAPRDEGPRYTEGLFGRQRRQIDQVDADIEALLARRFGEVPQRERVDTVAAAKALAQRLSYELRISGQHYSGVSNQGILVVRKREGRDFAADTAALRQKVAEKVAAAFKPGDWDDDKAAVAAADAVLDFIVRRVESDGGDIQLAPLDPEYAKWKWRKGLDPRIGVAKGEWLKALRRAAVVIT
jgi:hypothetical protein